MSRDGDPREGVRDETLASVIPQSDLLEFAKADVDETRSVLLEAAPLAPEVTPRESAAPGSDPRLRVAPFSEGDRQAIGERLATVAAYLEELGVERPVTLESAQVVVADLTPRQLRAVATHDATTRILVNEGSGPRHGA